VPVIRGVFVTGTDTNVGKTVVAAALMHRCRSISNLRYWKPIQTGVEQDDDTAAVARLGACRREELFTRGVRLRQPLSPHAAAALSEMRISMDQLRAYVASEPAEARWIVEGAGGVLVPINETDLMVDWMAVLAMPVVVVARSTLGTINHTLMTLEALRRRSLEVAGVVMVGEKNEGNREAIERFGGAAILGEMPRFRDLTPEAVAQWASTELDPAGRLLRCFQ